MGGAAAIFAQAHHRAALTPGARSDSGGAAAPRRRTADRAAPPMTPTAWPTAHKDKAGDPEAQAEAQARRQACRSGSRGCAERRRAGSARSAPGGPGGEARHRSGSAPSIRPALRRENEKKLRKKLDAANAIDRPNTIWISRRKPPLVSPNARVRPVTMMMMTAMILATGPSMDWRMALKRRFPRHRRTGRIRRCRSRAMRLMARVGMRHGRGEAP